MSKILSPKAWYLVGVGAVALAADGVRRLIKKRRLEAEQAPAVMSHEPDEYIPIFKPAAAAESISPAAPKQPAVVPSAAKAASRIVPDKPKKVDDLTEIKGIGPTFSKRLAEAGITSFTALAAASPDYLREITKAPAMANPDEWIAEARSK